MSNEIRPAMNKVNLLGVLKEAKDLEIKKDKENNNFIGGKLVLKCGEFSEVTLNVYVKELTKSGKVANNYKVLKGIIDKKYKSMANADEEESPVVLSVYGSGDFTPHFKENRYVREGATEVTTNIQIDLGFGNLSVKEDVEPEDYKARFDTELFVTSVEDEVKGEDEEETGRVKIKGYTPVYGGDVIKMEVVIPETIPDEEDGETIPFAEQIRDVVEEGNTIDLYGDINYERRIEKVKKGGKLGKAKVEENVSYIHELVADGAEVIEGDNEYDEEDIKKAVKERKVKFEELLDNAQEKEDKPKGLGTKKDSKDGKNKRDIKF